MTKPMILPRPASTGGRVSAFLTPTALARGFLWPALDAFHQSALAVLHARGERLLAARLLEVRRHLGEELAIG